jgi:hypothetical protein
MLRGNDGMDRFTWAAVVAVVVLCVAAMMTVLIPRTPQSPPDLATPDGVVVAYITAIRDKRADDAWALLDSPQAVSGWYGDLRGGSDPTQEWFRQQVNNNYYGNRNSRVRIVETRIEGDTARIDVEITRFADDLPFFGSASSSSTVTFNAKRQGSSWRITSSPSIWQLG